VRGWDYSIFVVQVFDLGGMRRGLLGGDGSQDITELLEAWGEGDQLAFERLVPLVYAELKRMARRHMYRESEGHLLQTTALVHEAYLKLVSQKNAKWQNRAHFFAVSSQQMRRILVDAARSRLRQKRGSDAPVASWRCATLAE
jgi:RNA polymerase sigma factor (TIGR02999 family)